MPGRRFVRAGRSTEDHVSDNQPSKPGASKPDRFPGVRFGDVPILALLAVAAVFGYVALDQRDRAPTPEAPALVSIPMPVPARPAPVAAPALAAEPIPVAVSSVMETVEEPPPAPPEPAATERGAEPGTAEAALGRLRDALAGVRCAELRVDLVDGTLTVSGAVASIDDQTRVQQFVDALAGDLAGPSAVIVASSALCEPLLLLEPARTANAARGTPLTVTTVPGDGVLTGGQDLVLDIRATGIAAHVQVDYFTVDGGVVHLLPNPLEPVARLEDGATRRLGERNGRARFWTVGPPFGHELIIVVTSSAPLFPVPRPEVEPAAAYLPELKRALAGPGAEGALAAALFIATRAP